MFHAVLCYIGPWWFVLGYNRGSFGGVLAKVASPPVGYVSTKVGNLSVHTRFCHTTLTVALQALYWLIESRDYGSY
jgi:hypothetical protein